MRELKFRVWSKKQKTYDYKHPFNTPGSFYIAQNGILFSDYGNVITPEVKQDNFVIEQFTGLHDKNGEEIWEGDILWWTHYYEGAKKRVEIIAKVRWEEKDASFVVGDWADQLGFLVYEDEVEVIGNYYENPELLEEKK